MDDENQREKSLEGRAHTPSTTAEKPITSSDAQPGIDDTLASINKNMSTMADILQKMYSQRETSVTSQPLRGKRPMGNKRSHAESEDSEQEPGQSESEESTTLERKRLRCRYSDDELSLEAGDSENKLRVNMFQKYFCTLKQMGPRD